jgi:tetratricopeptide (TPR) repeat protein
MRAWIVIIACLSTAGVARAVEDEEARQLYERGKTAFEQDHAQEAYDCFRKAYMISQRPALLFNMASALTKLDRPHDAAESLRAYLRVVPDDLDRVGIEERIRALEEKQRLLDDERRAREPPALRTPTTFVTTTTPPPPRPIYKRWWLWTLVGAGAAGVAIALGVTLSAPSVSYPTAATPDGRLRF